MEMEVGDDNANFPITAHLSKEWATKLFTSSHETSSPCTQSALSETETFSTKFSQDDAVNELTISSAKPDDLPLATKKQQLSLPNLISNAIVSRNPIETVSDECRKPVEHQLSVHSTVYLDAIQNLVWNSSTPVENPCWNTVLETSNVFFPDGRASCNTTSKEIALETIEDVVNCPPIIASTPALEEAASVASVFHSRHAKPDCLIENGVGVRQNFAKTGIRNSQPISPTSDSDVESSVMELVESTIAAPVEMQPSPEVEVDLASQFEKLVLSKQASTEVPQLDQVIPLEVRAQEGSLNDTVPLNEKPVKQIEEAATMKMEISVAEEEMPRSSRTEEQFLKATSNMPLAAEDSSNSQSPIEDVKEHADVGDINQTNEGNADQPRLPEDKPIVPKKGYDLSFLDKFENLENATPSFSHAKFPFPFPDTSQSSAQLETYTTVAITNDEEPSETFIPCSERNLEGESAALAHSNTGVPNAESNTEPKVEKEIVSLEEKPTDSLQEEDTPIPSAVSGSNRKDLRKDDEPVIPKKSYDLSWLDKCEDLENATPPGLSRTGKACSNRKSDKKLSFLEVGGSKLSETMSATDTPSEKQKSVAGHMAEPSNESPTTNTSAIKKSIRPECQRSTPPAKTADTFEGEFQFDPNDDPFKPKTKLSSSKNEEIPTSNFAQTAFEETFPSLEANSTITGTDGYISHDGNITVIDTMAEVHQGEDPISAQQTDQTLHADEEFRPAQEVFRDPSELDFLMQHGGSSHDIALARQSLFVKFDPLVGGRPSLFPPRESNGTSGGDETMLVEDQSSGRKSAGDSLFLFSPPHAPGTNEPQPDRKRQEPAVDCLMSAVNRVIADDVIGIHEHKEVLQRQELLFQDKLIQKEREILMREKQNQELKAELDCAIEAKTRINQTLIDFEKTISQLIADKEREKANMEATINATVKERDQAIEDLKEVERAFSEFHRMYERNRAAAERLQKNEEALKKSIDAFKERVQQEQLKFETLKLRSAEKLEKALEDMEHMKRTLESEITQLKAQLKKTEMRVASTEASLEQKLRENQELTKLCDELITKMGSGIK